MIGNGLYLAGSLLFFTRDTGLPAREVGVGLTIATLLGVLAGVPIGRAADRWNARDAFIATQLLQGTAMLVYPFVHSFAAFLAVAVPATIGQRGGMAVGGALIVRISAAGEATRTRAYLRSVSNLGTAVGLGAAGFALQADSSAGYLLLVLGNGLTFLMAGAMLLRLPRPAAVPAPPRIARWGALRDRSYLAVASLSGILAYLYDVVAIALPLWVVDDTAAPRWLVSILTIANTAAVVLFQVRATRGVTDTGSAARVVRRAGLLCLVSCAAFGLAAAASRPVAIVCLTVGILVHSLAEIWYASGTFELGYGLAQDHAQGEYQGVFSLAAGLVRASSPIVLVFLCLGWGRTGWILVGTGLALTGLAMPRTARWAEHRRASEISATARAVPPDPNPAPEGVPS